MSKISSMMMAMGIKKPSTAKVAKKAAAVVSKPAAKAEAKGAEALADQNKAFVKMKKGNMKATSSGAGNGGDVDGPDMDFFSAPSNSSYSIWGE